jgi:hypothetical protein
MSEVCFQKYYTFPNGQGLRENEMAEKLSLCELINIRVP